MVVAHQRTRPLEIILGLVSVTVEKTAPTNIRTERPPESFHGAVAAEEATTDHAGLQLEIDEGLAASRTPSVVFVCLLCHVE
jgi:hypothetical protein